jgi:hypothetical protein
VKQEWNPDFSFAPTKFANYDLRITRVRPYSRLSSSHRRFFQNAKEYQLSEPGHEEASERPAAGLYREDLVAGLGPVPEAGSTNDSPQKRRVRIVPPGQVVLCRSGEEPHGGARKVISKIGIEALGTDSACTSRLMRITLSNWNRSCFESRGPLAIESAADSVDQQTSIERRTE